MPASRAWVEAPPLNKQTGFWAGQPCCSPATTASILHGCAAPPATPPSGIFPTTPYHTRTHSTHLHCTSSLHFSTKDWAEATFQTSNTKAHD